MNIRRRMMMRKRIKELLEEYDIDDDIMSEDSEEYVYLRRRMDMVLTPAEVIIMLMYAECQSVRKLGKELGVSQSTAYKEVKKIQRKLKDGIDGCFADKCNS